MMAAASGTAWRRLCGATGILAAIAAAAGMRDPLASMASYATALMVLNQIVPPLLLLAVPPAAWSRWRDHLARFWISDPWVALGVFAAFTVAVSLPGIFQPAVANALFGAPLGALELACGCLIWLQLFRHGRSLDADWKAGAFGLLAGVPMTIVAVVWMLSPTVLYTPYLNVVCRWNIPPLQDQRWAGFFMLLAGAPLQLTSLWLILGLRSPRTLA